MDKSKKTMFKAKKEAIKALPKKGVPLKKALDKVKPRKPKEYFKTGIDGLDELLGVGIPKGSSVLLAGGAGSGKTIMALQIINSACMSKKRCLYMSFEEEERKLVDHMEDFGWDAKGFQKAGLLKIKRFNPFDITRSIDALLEKAQGDLLIDIDPIILPDGFKPEILVVDSLTAIASAFTKKEESYRIYIEQLFRFLEKFSVTSFLITETDQNPAKFSTTGVEEFLADGVLVLHTVTSNNTRERFIEILKLRGAEHQKKIAAMRIVAGKGMEVYPDQEVLAKLSL